MSMTSLLMASVAAQGGGGGGAPATATIIGTTGYLAGSNGGQLNYNPAPLGSAVSGRVLYFICPFFDGSTTASTPTAVTVGGNNATLITSQHLQNSTACGISIWEYRDDGALGSTAEVIVYHSTIRTSRSVVIVEARAGTETLIDDVGEAGSVSGFSGSSLDTAGASFLLYGSITQNGSESTPPAPFTDGTLVYDENSSEWVHIGWDNTPSGGAESVNVASGAGSRAAYAAIAVA